MALYLGSEKIKIMSSDNIYHLIIPSPIPNNVLLSLDNYILKDANGVYLVAKEDN